MKQTATQKIRRNIRPAFVQTLGGAVVCACALMAGPWAWADPEIHYHGFQLDEQIKVIFEQENGLVRITLVSRTRPVGIEPNREPEDPEKALLGRHAQRRVLAQARAEVLKPSAPNYLRNPGQRYRVIVEGVSVCPEYAMVFEVNAAQARKTMEGEIRKLAARAHGVDRIALGYAATMVPDILNQADRMPAALSDTVLRSEVGRIRVSKGTLQRRALPTTAPSMAGPLPEAPTSPAEQEANLQGVAPR
ncbi:MAG TPA: hypothetical protein PKZ01_07660 [Candidatus Hydrogenedentes bacterium]|nr:hypothetical protein [Candidatus Hydrogenedentota bacterium]